MVMKGEWFAPTQTMGAKTMTTFKKTATAALAALTLSVTVLATAGSAEARPRFHRGHGIGLGVVGALAVGGLLAATAGPSYAVPVYEDEVPVRRCGMVERYNRFGDVIGYRRVCSRY
jgi:hypothetical protein